MSSLEDRAIGAAKSYVVANGYEATDTTAVALVLAGMVLAAMLTDPTRDRIQRDYLRQNPASALPLARWAEHIERGL